MPVGHLTFLPAPGPLFQAGLMAARWAVKLAVVPDPSERNTTLIGLAAQPSWLKLVILPKNISTSWGWLSCSSQPLLL